MIMNELKIFKTKYEEHLRISMYELSELIHQNICDVKTEFDWGAWRILLSITKNNLIRCRLPINLDIDHFIDANLLENYLKNLFNTEIKIYVDFNILLIEIKE